MGFDTERLIVSFSKFSVSSKKQKYSSNNVGSSTAVPDQKISNSGNLKYQNIGAQKDVKGNDISSPTPSLFPSSPCISNNFCNEGNVPTDNFCNVYPTPKSCNSSRSILSFGNIYRTSNPVNDVPGINGKMGLGAPEPSQSSKNVLGFGGCNYGHGSIIKGVKNVGNLSNNVCEVAGSKALAEKAPSRMVPHFDSVEKLKNAGNQEYRRGRYMEAISYYDKAIALNCHNAACHNNKAAALAGLGKFTEAVGECLHAINYDPSYSRAHYRLGTLYTR